MSSDEGVKTHHSAGEAGSRRPGPGHYSTEVLPQRRRLPVSTKTLFAGGFVICAAIGYVSLYAKSRPGTTPLEAAKVAANTDGGADAVASKYKK